MPNATNRITFRISDDISCAFERIVDRDFSGNQSKLVNTYLRDRFEEDGELLKTAAGLDLQAFLNQALSSGVQDSEIVDFLVQKIEEQNKKEAVES